MEKIKISEILICKAQYSKIKDEMLYNSFIKD